jgi:hypothetical protein
MGPMNNEPYFKPANYKLTARYAFGELLKPGVQRPLIYKGKEQKN